MKVFYGSLRLHFTGLQIAKNPVIQFLQNQLVVDSIPLTGSLLTIPLFNPGQYNLRILYDDNKNTTWDAGSYSLKKATGNSHTNTR